MSATGQQYALRDATPNGSIAPKAAVLPTATEPGVSTYCSTIYNRLRPSSPGLTLASRGVLTTGELPHPAPW